MVKNLSVPFPVFSDRLLHRACCPLVYPPSHAKPSEYQLLDLPRPEITDPNDVIIKVRAASVNPVDLKKAEGVFKAALEDFFPYKIGYNTAGTVAETGTGVTWFKIGSWSEYAVCPEYYIILKPPLLLFEEAASILLAATTAFQALRKYDGGLLGKTIFTPAGSKNVLHAGKVITTVLILKVFFKVPELLGEGTVNKIINYSKVNPKSVIKYSLVDFLFDTTSQAIKLCASGYGVNYSYMFLKPSAEDLDILRGYTKEGKLKQVVGTTVDLQDIGEVREACQVVYSNQGGLGKVVIRVTGAGAD
ncbi:chaperonin 10-like protein [Aspergillus varians]